MTRTTPAATETLRIPPDLKPSDGRAPMLETCKLASISSRYTLSKTSSLAASAPPSRIAPSWTHCAVQMSP